MKKNDLIPVHTVMEDLLLLGEHGYYNTSVLVVAEPDYSTVYYVERRDDHFWVRHTFSPFDDLQKSRFKQSSVPSDMMPLMPYWN
tara:strand:- start:689 stop:943 length:255 start_codon:yes stop_codon:yes gene_type:complete